MMIICQKDLHFAKEIAYFSFGDNSHALRAVISLRKPQDLGKRIVCESRGLWPDAPVTSTRWQHREM